MALRDYASIDEEDYYGQGFRMEGRVSIWVGTESLKEESEDLDILQDWCGVGAYDPDFYESHFDDDFRDVRIADAVSELSYCASFGDQVVQAALARHLSHVKWIVAEYDFDYDPRRVKRPTNPKAVFLGAFDFQVVIEPYDEESVSQSDEPAKKKNDD